MKIVYVCNEVNLQHGWGVLSYSTIVEATNSFSEVIVLTLVDANNIDLSEFKSLEVHPILTSMNDRFYKIGLTFIDKIKIKQYLDIESIDIVHILVEPLLPLVSVFKNSKKVFGIVGTYADYPFRMGINQYLYMRSLKYVDEVVSISEYTKDRVNEFYNKNITVIPLGVDYKRFQPRSFNTKEKAFVFVGHIKPRKGLIYALKAFKDIMINDNDIKFYIVGAKTEGPYADKCLKYIEDENLSKQVILVGKVSDDELVNLYQKSIANILTSINEDNHFEGFGLIHLEANACGTPSIGSKGCGNESAIVDGVTGYLCQQKNITEIKKKMELIIQDFNNNSFAVWETNCLAYAKVNDWSTYFKNLKERVYKL